jgi:hypothetical protein
MRKKIKCLATALIFFSGGYASALYTNSITPDSAESYLVNYCYDIMKYQTYGMSFILAANIASDEAYAGGGVYDDYTLIEIDSFSLDCDNYYVESLWEKYYASIERCNLLLADIGTSTGGDYDRYAAEARCLRAYFYFCLVRYYGGVPLWISDSTEELNDLPRATLSEVYDQIESDLSGAIPYLPQRSGLPAGENFRLTSGAVRSLLGKVHLFQEEWEQAATQLEQVINSGQYELLENFSEVWETANEFSFESIFEIPFTSVPEDGDCGNYDVMLMAFRGGMSAGDTYRGGWGLAPLTPGLVQAYEDQVDTIRLKSTIVDEETILADGCAIMTEDSRNYTGYFNNKYASLASDYVHDFYSEKNEIILRYADVLLMCAEAKCNLGDFLTAQAYLNLVRQRVSLDEIDASGEDLLQAIQEERRREMALEGDRLFDLVRWGKASEVLADMGYKPYNNVCPIPQSAFFLNPDLIQNPGYTIPSGLKINDITVNEHNLQVFPNPAREKLELSFNLHQPGDVLVSVYSVTGREVANYRYSGLPAGANCIEADAGGINNGVYMIVLESGINKSVIKAVILK